MLERIVRAGLRRGFRDGLVGGNRAWLAVGTVALGVRLLRKLSRPEPVVVCEPLRPGETLVIAHLPEPS